MHPRDIILIAGIGRNHELGRGADLVWRFKGDLMRFKDLTMGHPMIMGRKTFESIGKPLPGRTSIVITRDPDWSHPRVVVAHSLDEALGKAKEIDPNQVAVIGGGEIFTQALPYATRLEMTLVDAVDVSANIFFPEYENDFKEIARQEPREENGIKYQWVTFERN